VFKVQEVIHCPPLTRVPQSHAVVRGIADIRGRTIPVVDLARVLGKEGPTDPREGFVIVTEYNNSVQGYLVSAVDRIINMNWEEILPPPKGMGLGRDPAAAQGHGPGLLFHRRDASGRQVRRYHRCGKDSGRHHAHALGRRQDLFPVHVDDAIHRAHQITLYRVPPRSGRTTGSRYVLLHSSLSGVFNKAMVEKVGANHFIAKYDPDLLTKTVLKRIEELGLEPETASESGTELETEPAQQA